MVVCLNLETYRVQPVEVDDPGIVLEDRKAPLLVESTSRLHDGAAQKVVDSLAVDMDTGLESLMHAVL